MARVVSKAAFEGRSMIGICRNQPQKLGISQIVHMVALKWSKRAVASWFLCM